MKRVYFFSLFFILICRVTYGQIIDIDYSRYRGHALSEEDPKVKEAPGDILKGGFLDFLSDGNIQASAQVLRLRIGHPDKFYIPFYIYSGVAGDAFGKSRENSSTVANLLNPVGGTINVSFNGLQNIVPGDDYTRLRFAYQLGARVLNGKDSTTGDGFYFMNAFGNAGLFFQTGAWSPDDSEDNMGVFYIQAKLTGALSSEGNFAKTFGRPSFSSGFLYGYAVDAGIEINKVINAKLSISQYINNTDISLLKDPLVKFSVDYSFGK